jgi:hypothetical protein
MPQVFPQWTNAFARLSIAGSLFSLVGLTWMSLVVVRNLGTGEGQARVQPVPFSHQHHVGVLGIDCRYCHTSVERSSFAGMPPTKTCMNCHSQMWVRSEMLQPVRHSYDSGESLRWERVYNTPGFVYFDHSIHIHKGIGCASCHGRVDEMPFLFQEPSLLMEWCIKCHRNPAREIRPRREVFNMQYQPPADQLALGRKLVEQYDVKDAKQLTSCSVCHR